VYSLGISKSFLCGHRSRQQPFGFFICHFDNVCLSTKAHDFFSGVFFGMIWPKDGTPVDINIEA